MKHAWLYSDLLQALIREPLIALDLIRADLSFCIRSTPSHGWASICLSKSIIRKYFDQNSGKYSIIKTSLPSEKASWPEKRGKSLLGWGAGGGLGEGLGRDREMIVDEGGGGSNTRGGLGHRGGGGGGGSRGEGRFSP